MQKNFHDTKKELPNIVIAKWNPNGLYLLDSFGNGQMGSTNDQRNCSEEKVKKIMDSEESKRL